MGCRLSDWRVTQSGWKQQRPSPKPSRQRARSRWPIFSLAVKLITQTSECLRMFPIVVWSAFFKRSVVFHQMKQYIFMLLSNYLGINMTMIPMVFIFWKLLNCFDIVFFPLSFSAVTGATCLLVVCALRSPPPWYRTSCPLNQAIPWYVTRLFFIVLCFCRFPSETPWCWPVLG